MTRQFTSYPKFPNVKQAYGCLLAAKDDIENGALFEIKSLITAEVFDDLLEQAKTLLDSGYFAPAAVVIGSVLEDALRKLCDKHSIPISNKEKLDSMNSQLVKAGVYNTLTQKKVTALADIRNSAAHGKWSEFSKSDVEDMLRWTNGFMEKHYG